MRLFIAVDPPEPVLDDLAAAVAELGVSRAGARVTARPLWHITLAFLGEVDDARLPAVAAAMDTSVAAIGRPVLSLAGGGRFGRGKFTILWVGVDGDLVPLRRAVTRNLRQARISFDDKRFNPHLTLSRPGDRVPAETIAADRALLSRYQGPQWTAEEIVLMRSHLGPNPVYEPLHRTAL
jgi:2'-5' RNA ligase